MSINAITNNARDYPPVCWDNLTLYNNFVNFASYNCRTMLPGAAGELIARSLNQRDVDIACLSEVRLPNEGSKTLSPARAMHPDLEQFVKNRPNSKWPCPKCWRDAKKNAVLCRHCGEWWHLPCANINLNQARRAKNWKCEFCEHSENQLGTESADYKMFWSGPNDGSGLHGVAVLVKAKLANAVTSWEAVSPRLLILKISAKPMDIVVIAAYAPTEDAEAVIKDEFYNQLDSVMSRVKNAEFLLMGGDFNARLGPGLNAERSCVGKYGIGIRNDNGYRLMDFLQSNKLFAANTNFRHKSRHLATWKSPDGKTFNQIDYILIKSRWRTSVYDARSYWGSCWSSDHAVLCARLRLRFSTQKKKPVTRRLNVDRLALTEQRQIFKEKVVEGLQQTLDVESVSARWLRLKNSINCAAQETVGVTSRPRKQWITKGTLELIEKNKHSDRSRDTRMQIKRAIKEDLENHWNRFAAEMEHAAAVGDSRKLFQLLKCGKRSAGISENITGANGEELPDLPAKLDRWAEYFDGLLNRPLPNEPLEMADLNNVPELDISVDPPSEAEVSRAVRKLKSGKAPGEDQIPPECWKACGEAGMKELTEIVRSCWTDETIPDGWNLAVIIPLFKKGDKNVCSNHRGISLLDLAMKVLEIVIIDRIKPHREISTRESQAGFRSGRGCSDQIFCLRQLIERRYEYRRPFVGCFVDFSAAFDSVHRDSMWNIVLSQGIPPKLVAMLKAIYNKTMCCVRVYNSLTNSFEVSTGVRQGAIGSPILFNFVIDWILNTALQPEDGVDMGNSDLVTDLTFADDIALLAENQNAMQEMLNRVHDAASRVGMLISTAKTKAMSCAGNQVLNLNLNGAPIEQVQSFKYLGSEIGSSGQALVDINARVAKAAAAMNALKSLWRKRNVSIKTKKRVYLASVRPVLMYGCESWPVLKQHERKLDVFEHRSWRRILRISYLDHVTNDEVRRRFGVEETIAAYVKKRRLVWFGHVARMPVNRLPHRILFSTVNPVWKRPTGGVRKTWLRKIHQDLNVPPVKRSFRGNINRWKANWLFHCQQLAQDRSAFKSLILDDLINL